MTATLTDRYIDAVVRALPAASQADVRAELEGSIADAVDARTDQGDDVAVAERAVITGLGDPAALAAGYADRPLQLIGPRYYLTWWRLLKLLVWIVPVCAVVGVTIANVLADQPIGTTIGQAFAVGLGAVVHVAFWTTLVFVILERTGADTGIRWSPDALPEPHETGAGRGDLIGSLVLVGVLAAALLWDRFIGFVLVSTVDDLDVTDPLGAQTAALPVLNPELWPWWLGGALVVLAAEAALAIAVYASRGWRASFAAINSALAVLFAAGALYLLATDRLVNPAFVEFTMGRGDVPVDVERILAILLGVGIVGVAGWDAIDGWLKVRRARRA